MVYSLCPAYNELDIAEIRFATLDDVVDVHVIGESELTHSGKTKPLYFKKALDAGRFDRWKHKIRLLNIDLSDPPPSDYATRGTSGEVFRDAWAREKEQRRRLIDGFDGSKSDLILLSDLDEIPHPDAVRSGISNILLCKMHVAKLNYRWKTPAHESHSIARIFLERQVTATCDLEALRLTHMEPQGPPGWHLSWMQGIGQKLGAFVHQEMVPYARPDLALQGGKLFPGLVEQELEWCDLDQLPPYVAENKEKFAHLIVEER